MIDFLYSIDKAVFVFVNQTLSNPVTDILWPLITNYDKLLAVRIVLVGVWIWLLWKGGKNGRTVALLIIPLIVVSDQLSSSVIKELVQRPRPCYEIDGVPILQNIHLLVNCGSGKSFPSSHAVNNFALATLFSYYNPRRKWWFVAAASLVALSRVGVGVHYPSDIAGGAIIGIMIALAMIWLWNGLDRRFFSSNAPTEIAR